MAFLRMELGTCVFSLDGGRKIYTVISLKNSMHGHLSVQSMNEQNRIEFHLQGA